jgi:hypothetical protein
MRHTITTLALCLPLGVMGCEPDPVDEVIDPAGVAPAPGSQVDDTRPTIWALVHPSQSDAPGIHRIDLEHPEEVLEVLALPEELLSPHSLAFDTANRQLLVAGSSSAGALTRALDVDSGAVVIRDLPAAIEVAFDDDGVLWFATDSYYDRRPARPDGYQYFGVPAGLTGLLVIDGEMTTLVNGERDWLQSWAADWTPTNTIVLPSSLVATYAAVAWQDALLVAQDNTIHVVRDGVVERSVTLPVGPWITGLTIDPR